MRGYETIIVEAELLVSSPETVHQFLKTRASKTKDELWDDPVDQATEEALRLRQEPLIDLSLAMYARYINAVKPLFSLNVPSSAIRLAILSNRALNTSLISMFPGALFANPEELKAWLTDAPTEEISALFENSAIDQVFLADFLEGKKDWAKIPEDRLVMIVAMLANNERMSTSKSFDDGWADHMYQRVFDQAWALAERVPTTDDWAKALSWLYDRLQPQCHSIKAPLAVAMRWYPTSEAQKTMDEEYRGGSPGHLSSYEYVRKGLASLAIRYRRESFKELMNSDDRAFRAAAYANGQLTIAQLEAAYRKDAELAYNEAVTNKHLWKKDATRNALREIARLASQDDKSGDRMAINFYDKVGEAMEKNHPEWFRGNDTNEFSSVEEDNMATKSEQSQLLDKLQHPITQPQLIAIQRQLKWLLIMCAFLVVAVIFGNGR